MTDIRLPASKRDWLALIRDLDIRPLKGRGQNFLHDSGVVNRIVNAAGVSDGDTVVEIGPGLGILTSRLAAVANRVVAIEIDSQLARHLERIFATTPNVEIIRGDATKFDLAEIAGESPIRVVANLPYSAAAAITRQVLESDAAMISATFMVQREVGLRMIAEPPNMSILSVATQVYATGVILFDVPPDVFEPRPTVESIVLQLTPHALPILPQKLRPAFFSLVHAGFRHKRKNIANSLADETGLPKQSLNETLISAGIEPMRRAQTLSIVEWLKLLDAWQRQIGPIGQ
jgi:16S rRNA (adenine1518-N6/adenine1519-N6)-dimethyltransferase